MKIISFAIVFPIIMPFRLKKVKTKPRNQTCIIPFSGLDHRFVRANSFWIPAFAGMTKKTLRLQLFVIPAKAGIQTEPKHLRCALAETMIKALSLNRHIPENIDTAYFAFPHGKFVLGV